MDQIFALDTLIELETAIYKNFANYTDVKFSENVKSDENVNEMNVNKAFAHVSVQKLIAFTMTIKPGYKYPGFL